jgi:tetratricopeptide (TPR) repeat protein
MERSGVHRLHCACTQICIGVAACLMLSPAAQCQAQSNSRFDVQGEVVNIVPGDTLEVELRSIDGMGMPQWADVSGSGSFEFDSLPVGDYALRLKDQYGNTIYERVVSISGLGNDLTIRLPDRKIERPVNGTVSVGELRQQQKIPPNALQEFRKGDAELAKRHFDKARVHFQKATTIDPSFASAHNELGAAFWGLRQTDNAVAEFRTASKLDPDSPAMLCNFSLALLATARFPEAEAAARAALRVDPNLIEAHFVLGYSLYKQKRHDLEAVESLQRAGDQYPKGRLMAAEILVRLARKAEAVVELRKYLGSSDTSAARQQAESWLEALTGPPTPSSEPAQLATSPARTAIVGP